MRVAVSRITCLSTAVVIVFALPSLSQNPLVGKDTYIANAATAESA